MLSRLSLIGVRVDTIAEKSTPVVSIGYSTRRKLLTSHKAHAFVSTFQRKFEHPHDVCMYIRPETRSGGAYRLVGGVEEAQTEVRRLQQVEVAKHIVQKLLPQGRVLPDIPALSAKS